MEPISWTDFWIIFVTCALTILACRVAPLFLLKGKQLPKRVEEALGFIPPAAFAALVANDLLTPGIFIILTFSSLCNSFRSFVKGRVKLSFKQKGQIILLVFTDFFQ